MDNYINQAIAQRRLRDMLLAEENTAAVNQMQPMAEMPVQAPEASQRQQSAQSYRDVLTQGAPKQADYQPSKGRRFVGGLLGAFAGLRDPNAGYKASSTFVNAPYNTAQSEYERKVTGAGDLAKFDESSYMNELAGQEKVARTGAEEARRQAELARKEELNRRVVRGPQDYLNEIQLKGDLDLRNKEKPTYEITLKDGKKMLAHLDEQTGDYKVGNTTISKDHVTKSLKPGTANQEKTDSPNSPYEVALAQWKIDNPNRMPNAQEQQQLITQSESPSLKSQRGMTVNLGGVKLQNDKDMHDPAVINNLVSGVKANPDSFFALPDAYKKPVIAAMSAAGLPIPAKVSAAVQDRGNRADVSLQHVGQLREMLKDPDISSSVGPAKGRALKWVLGVGAQPLGMTDEKAQKLSEFKSRLAQFLIQETTVANSRPAKQLLDIIKQGAPDMKQALSLLKGSIDAAEASAKMTLKSKTNAQFGEGAGVKKNKYEELLQKLGEK